MIPWFRIDAIIGQISIQRRLRGEIKIMLSRFSGVRLCFSCAQIVIIFVSCSSLQHLFLNLQANSNIITLQVGASAYEFWIQTFSPQ